MNRTKYEWHVISIQQQTNNDESAHPFVWHTQDQVYTAQNTLEVKVVKMCSTSSGWCALSTCHTHVCVRIYVCVHVCVHVHACVHVHICVSTLSVERSDCLPHKPLLHCLHNSWGGGPREFLQVGDLHLTSSDLLESM